MFAAHSGGVNIAVSVKINYGMQISKMCQCQIRLSVILHKLSIRKTDRIISFMITGKNIKTINSLINHILCSENIKNNSEHYENIMIVISLWLCG